MSQNVSYWVVGATVQGEDLSADFIQKGIWFGDKESAQDDIAKIQAGDRIAIKKMLGHGAKEVEIKAIGIVEKVGKYEAMNFPILYVKWLSLIDESGQGRRVPFSGFGGTIHFAQVDRRSEIFLL